MTSALLITADMSDKLWCFAMQYYAFLITSTEHSVTKRLPIWHFFGGKNAFPPSKGVIWGSKIRIIKQMNENRTLDAQTGGNSRGIFNYSSLTTPVKLTFCCGIFLRYCNNVSVNIWYTPQTKRIVCCRHAIIGEDRATLQLTDQ